MMMIALAAAAWLVGHLPATGAALAADLSPQTDAGQVGLVIVLADGVVETHCVSIDGAETTGYDVLLAADLALEIDARSGSQAICRIADTGCPGDDCFCACTGTDCIYWSYWHLIDGAWRFSLTGAGVYRVSAGDVEGWVWGPGSVTEAVPPPPLTFEAICGVAEDGLLGSELASDAVASIATDPAPTTLASEAPVTATAIASVVVAPTVATATDGDEPEQGVTYATYLPLLAVLGVIAAVWLVAVARGKAGRRSSEQDHG